MSDAPGERREQVPESPATIGLLPYLNRHTVDEDYAQVAARPDGRPRSRPLWTVLVVAVFVLLLLTAASQTSRDAVAVDNERRDLIGQIQHRKDLLQQDQTTLTRLRSQVATLRGGLANNSQLSSGTRAELRVLSVRAGTVPVRGPGVSVVVDDAPNATSDRSRVLDSDLLQLVNGLWAAGAEAIAINGYRLTNLSAIRQAGSAITVNFTSLDRPYQVDAIGDPATMPERFGNSSSGSTWLDLHEQVGLQFSMHTRTSLTLPAAATPTLRYAGPARGSASSPKQAEGGAP